MVIRKLSNSLIKFLNPFDLPAQGFLPEILKLVSHIVTPDFKQ